MKNQKALATIYLLYLSVSFVVFFRFFLSLTPHNDWMLRTWGRSKGVPEAGLKITEFFDYQCPSCGEARRILDDFFQKYPGEMFLELRFHPIPSHRHGFQSALYAYCANKQNRFWAWDDLLFTKQAEWAPLASSEATFRQYADSIGLEKAKLEACLKDPASENFIKEEKRNNESLGINRTPSFLINNKLVVGSKSLRNELMDYFSTATKGDKYDDTAVYS